MKTIRTEELYELNYGNSLLYLEALLERLTAFLSRRLYFYERQYILKCKFEIEKLMARIHSLEDKQDENFCEFVMQKGDKVFQKAMRLRKLLPLN